MKVNHEMVSEFEPRKFCADMSDIGLTVAKLIEIGQYPEKLETEIGNGQPFVLTRTERNQEGDELVALHYEQLYGRITLTLFND